MKQNKSKSTNGHRTFVRFTLDAQWQGSKEPTHSRNLGKTAFWQWIVLLLALVLVVVVSLWLGYPHIAELALQFLGAK